MIDILGIAWAAGLFEGEGSFSVRRYGEGGRVGLRMSLSSTDFDVIEKFWRTVGCGNVGGPYWHSASTKPQYAWTLNRAGEFIELASRLRPYLGERRKAKLDECLTAYKEQPPRGNHNRDKTECPKGHPYLEPNILWDEGRRRCRECERKRSERKNRRVRELRARAAIEDVARKMGANR